MNHREFVDAIQKRPIKPMTDADMFREQALAIEETMIADYDFMQGQQWDKDYLAKMAQAT